MKRVCWVLALLLAVAVAAGANAPAYDLGELAGVELQELRQDIEAERRLHHMVAEKEQTVYVHENRGRYSGYSAEWEVTLRLIP